MQQTFGQLETVNPAYQSYYRPETLNSVTYEDPKQFDISIALVEGTKPSGSGVRSTLGTTV